MKNTIKLTTAALLASTAMATAGGIDRSGQSVDFMFEEGTYIEFGMSYVDLSISGEDATTAATGDIAPAYTMVTGAFKMDFGQFSAGLIFDQPFGADILYPTPGSVVFPGSAAELNSTAVTAILGYDVTDNIVVFGGVKMQTLEATATVTPVSGYTVDAASDTGYGYVAGAAYQIPEIALRVALTYHSSVTTDHTTVEANIGPFSGTTTTTVTTPQSINLEAQTAINLKTMVFGSVRWVDWSAFTLAPAGYGNAAVAGVPLVSYNSDVFTYSLGVGRALTENLSGAVTIGYEAAQGGFSSALAPTDGNMSVGAGLSYTVGDAKISFGGKYIWLGDTSVNPGAGGGAWTGNTGMAFGMNISTSF